jgi:hypothetical protein
VVLSQLIPEGRQDFRASGYALSWNRPGRWVGVDEAFRPGDAVDELACEGVPWAGWRGRRILLEVHGVD